MRVSRFVWRVDQPVHVASFHQAQPRDKIGSVQVPLDPVALLSSDVVRDWFVGHVLDTVAGFVLAGITFGWKRILRAVRRKFEKPQPPSIVHYRTRRQKRTDDPKLPF